MLNSILKNLGKYKLSTVLTPIFILFEVLLEIIIPILMVEMIDKGINNKDMDYVIKTGVLMLLCAGLALGFGILAGITGAHASTGLSKNLRSKMFHKIQTFSFANIDKYSTASLVTRLTTDVANVQNAFHMSIRMFTRAPLMLILAMVSSFYINKTMAFIFLGAIIFLGVALFFIMSKAHPHFKAVFEKYDALNGSVQENLTGIRVVKAYVREEYEVTKFHKASEAIYKYFLNAEKIIIYNAPFMQFTMYACIILMSWIGANLIVSETMTTGELMSMFSYTGNIIISLMMLSMIFVMVVMSKSSIERISEVINQESTIKNNENPIYEIKDGSIEFKNASFSYKNDSSNLVLEHVNIKINSGETIGIIGGTGSAKTSLVQLIPRLYDVTNGSVEVAGVDVRNYDIEALRDQVSMVLQKNVLFSGTIVENLKWGNKDATMEDIIKACKQAQAHEFIEKMPNQYETYIEQGGSNVSGGQKQRLCIARALLKNPKILILDDSTSAVDTKTDTLIRNSFKKDIPDVTKLIIAQRISSIETADKIIVVHDGQIIGFGPHEELLKNNTIYQEVYYSQMRGAKENE